MHVGRPRLHARLCLGAGMLVLTLALPQAALAERFQRDRTPLPPSLSQAAESGGSAASSGEAFFRLAIGLVLVIAVIAGIYWLLRRSGRGGAAAGLATLPVVASAQLAPNRAVHLLRVGDELVLVGSAESGVGPIRVYTAAQAKALVEALEREETARRLRPSRGGAGLAAILDELRRRTAR